MNEINKLNPLLEAMNDIDDAFVTETAPVERKRPKYFKPMMIAAAAAVLMIITGAAVVYNRNSKSMTINGEPMFEYNYKVMESVTPVTRELMLEMGAEIISDDDVWTEYRITALPGELFAALNMPSRINENFIEERSAIKVSGWKKSEQPDELAVIFLEFSLVDKNNGKTVDFKVDCTRTEDYVLGGLGIISLHDVDGETHNEDVENELLTLNDGSQAVAFKWGLDEEWSASFAYDGLVYTKISVNSSDYDDIITILTDLGVL